MGRVIDIEQHASYFYWNFKLEMNILPCCGCILIIYPRMKAVDLNLTYVRRQKKLKGCERVFLGRCELYLLVLQHRDL